MQDVDFDLETKNFYLESRLYKSKAIIRQKNGCHPTALIRYCFIRYVRLGLSI